MSAASIENIGRMLADGTSPGCGQGSTNRIPHHHHHAQPRRRSCHACRAVSRRPALRRQADRALPGRQGCQRLACARGAGRAFGRDRLRRPASGMFEEYLEQIGGRITTQLLVVRGRTRDNITIVDPIDDTETHLRDEGFSVTRRCGPRVEQGRHARTRRLDPVLQRLASAGCLRRRLSVDAASVR